MASRVKARVAQPPPAVRIELTNYIRVESTLLCIIVRHILPGSRKIYPHSRGRRYTIHLCGADQAGGAGKRALPYCREQCELGQKTREAIDGFFNFAPPGGI